MAIKPRAPKPNQPSRNPEPVSAPRDLAARLRHLKQLLTLTAGRTLGVTELSQLSGRAEGTIENWLEGEPMQQVDFIFRLLERLPVRQQEEWWQNHVRLHPSLTHPRLAHDPLVAHQLQTLSAQPTGLTVIQAATMFPRAFVLMALGNSAWLPIRGKFSRRSWCAFLVRKGVCTMMRRSSSRLQFSTYQRSQQIRSVRSVSPRQLCCHHASGSTSRIAAFDPG